MKTQEKSCTRNTLQLQSRPLSGSAAILSITDLTIALLWELSLHLQPGDNKDTTDRSMDPGSSPRLPLNFSYCVLTLGRKYKVQMRKGDHKLSQLKKLAEERLGAL